MNRKQKVLIIVGPTSSGKSALAVQLARKFNGEVISADSRQVYKGFDIGTGKIMRHDKKGVRHHLLDVCSSKKVFTAHDFVERARRAIEDIASRDKLPIIAGGTGFYIDALLGRVTLPDVPANANLRAKLEKKTSAHLFAELQKKDPRRARSIDPHNKRRLIRALEIIASFGKVSRNMGLRNMGLRNPYFDALWIGLTLGKQELDKKIAIRLRARIRQGMIAEAKRLHTQGLSYKRMNKLGLEYRALSEHLQGKLSRSDMIDRLNRDILRYSKRQLTYWRRNTAICWCAPSDRNLIERMMQTWLDQAVS